MLHIWCFPHVVAKFMKDAELVQSHIGKICPVSLTLKPSLLYCKQSNKVSKAPLSYNVTICIHIFPRSIWMECLIFALLSIFIICMNSSSVDTCSHTLKELWICAEKSKMLKKQLREVTFKLPSRGISWIFHPHPSFSWSEEWVLEVWISCPFQCLTRKKLCLAFEKSST